jgi:iron complex outermembrane receptor protein
MSSAFGHSLLAAASLIAIATPALAQENPPPSDINAGGVEEIVVTAQKREQNLQDVPVAVTAFSAATINRLGLSSTEDLAGFTPNLNYQPAGGIGSSIGIRGIQDQNFTFNQVGSVAMVVDEVALNSPNLNTFALFDISRIEVLRGPQVTLFGRSTTGGALSVATRQARVGEEANGEASVSYGRFNAVDVQGAAGAPIGDMFAARLAGQYQKRDGIQRNVTRGVRDGERDRYALRGSLAFSPSDSFLVTYSGLYGKDNGQQPNYLPIGFLQPGGGATVCNNPSLQPGNGCADPYGFISPGKFNESYSNFRSFAHSKVFGNTLNIALDVGPVTLSSISAVIDHSISRQEDVDSGSIGRVEVHNDVDTNQKSQEFRIATNGKDKPFNFVGGLFLFDEENSGHVARSILTAGNGTPPIGLNSLIFRQKTKITSAYGQFDISVSDQFSLVAGVRYSDESKRGTARSYRRTGAGTAAWTNFAPSIGTHLEAASLVALSNPAQNSGDVPFGKSWSNWGGKVGLNFKPSDDALIYASVSKGFKGGTFNLIPAYNLQVAQPIANLQKGVDPEKITSYEIGTKLEFFDRKLQLNIAGFLSDYQNQQVFTFIGGAAALLNAGKASINGIEAELTWAPEGGWLIQGGLGLLDAKYDSFILPEEKGGPSFAGKRTPHTPKAAFTGLVQKTYDIGDNQLSAQISFKQTSSQFAGFHNTPDEFLPSRTTFDARLRYLFGMDRNFEITVFGKNVFDKRFCQTIQPGSFTNQCIVNEPGTYGVKLGIKF